MSAKFRVQIGAATVTAGYEVPVPMAYPADATMADGWAFFTKGRPPQDLRQPFVGLDLPRYSDLAPEEAGLLAATLTAAAAFATRQAEEAHRQGPPPPPPPLPLPPRAKPRAKP